MVAAPQSIAEDLLVPDEVLVERIRDGDRDAFTAIYERYFKRVYHFVNRRMNNRADAEETVQEVFLNIFNSIDGYRGEAPFGAWVFGLTRRTIASRFKKKRHPTVPLHEDEAETAPVDGLLSMMQRTPSPIENYECMEQISKLEESIESRLSDEQRQLFDLHHLQSRPIQEIATILQKSEDSIKSNLYRTRRILLGQ